MDPMQIHASNDFAAEPEQVYAMLTDRVFLRANALASQPLEHAVSVEGSVTKTRRVMPTPSVAARLAGPRMAIVDEITWAPAQGDVRTGAALIEVEGLPAKLVGTVQLSPGGRGTLLTYDGDFSVNVPLLGPSLTRQAAPLLLEAIELQQKVGDQYLAARVVD